MFAEKALGELPVVGQLSGGFHQGVYPGDTSWGVRVFDAVASLGVVLHYLAGAAPAIDVYLEEDCGPVAADAYAVFVYETLDDDGVQEGS